MSVNAEFFFVVTTFLSLFGIGLAILKPTKQLLIFSLWALITGLLSYFEFYLNTSAFPPRILTVLIPSSLIVIYVYKAVSPQNLNLGWLLAIHLVRIPVELILHKLYVQGEIPQIMTYEGWNFDILSGISAVFILILHHTKSLKPQWLYFWNWAALLLLITIVVIAILSSPIPFQQLAFEQPNTAVLRFPFTWLPAIVVPIVFLSHLLTFKYIKKMHQEN